jgi:ABC transporter
VLFPVIPNGAALLLADVSFSHAGPGASIATRERREWLPPANRTGPLLTVSGLSRGFGEIPVLTGVDLNVGWGEAVAVTGHNGSGKTTLLRCVAGADRPSPGTVELCGRPLRERDPGISPAGISAAALRTATRPPLDYSAPPVPTPFGDLPLDELRQQLRGPLLLAVVLLIVVSVR